MPTQNPQIPGARPVVPTDRQTLVRPARRIIRDADQGEPTLHQLKPYDPESKGIVERRNGFFETSFMPGRTFDSPADFNTQFRAWLELANGRVVRTLKARPIDLVDADRAAMLALPPVPLQVGWRNQIRLGRDYCVRIDASDYWLYA